MTDGCGVFQEGRELEGKHNSLHSQDDVPAKRHNTISESEVLSRTVAMNTEKNYDITIHFSATLKVLPAEYQNYW